MDIPSRSWKSLPLLVRQAMRQIRAKAKIFFTSPLRFKHPNNYVVVRVDKTWHESEESWKRRHPKVPWCPTVPERVHLSKLENWGWFDMKYKTGIRLTEADILRNGDKKLTNEQAHAIWLWLNWKYRPNKPPDGKVAKKRSRQRRCSDFDGRHPPDMTAAEFENMMDAPDERQNSISDKSASNERTEVDDDPLY
jgi:hypothetical protein